MAKTWKDNRYEDKSNKNSRERRKQEKKMLKLARKAQRQNENRFDGNDGAMSNFDSKWSEY